MYTPNNSNPSNVQVANRALIERHPYLLPRNVFTDIVPDDYDYEYTLLDEMGDGWHKAFGLAFVEELTAALGENVVRNYRVNQIKDKFGELRWYDNGATCLAHDVIDKYTMLSRITCYNCGAADATPNPRDIYSVPLCRECKEEQDKRMRQRIDEARAASTTEVEPTAETDRN